MNLNFLKEYQEKVMLGMVQKLEMLQYLETWKKQKEKEGYIPTIEDLIEELKEKYDN